MSSYSIKVIISLLLVVGVWSCNPIRDLLPNSTGRANEVIVIMDKFRWDTSLGDTIRAVFANDMEVLPQSEPIFDLVNINPAAFTNIFKTHRNLMFIKVGADYKKAGHLVQKDLDSKPQLVLTFYASSDTALANYISQHAEQLQLIMFVAERKRIEEGYLKIQNKELESKLRANHQLSLSIPQGYKLDVDSSNFVWISNETAESTQGVLIWEYPYTNTNAFELNNLVVKRNEILKKYVAGPHPNSYMTTELAIQPQMRDFKVKGRFTTEMRGLWKLENGFMGGPFVNITQIDTLRNRVVTVEAFVYAPHGKKRNLLRQLESIIYSLEFSPLSNQELDATKNDK